MPLGQVVVPGVDPLIVEAGAGALATVIGWAVAPLVAGPLGRALRTGPLTAAPEVGGIVALTLGIWATCRPKDLGIAAPSIASGYPLPTLIAIGVATAAGALCGSMAATVRWRGSAAPLRFVAQHTISGGIFALVVGLVICVTWTPGDRIVIALLTAMSALSGVLIMLPLRSTDLGLMRAWMIAGAGLAWAAGGIILDSLPVTVGAALGAGIFMRAGRAELRGHGRSLGAVLLAREPAAAGDDAGPGPR